MKELKLKYYLMKTKYKFALFPPESFSVTYILKAT